MLVPKYKIGEELYAVQVVKPEKKIVRISCDMCNGTGSIDGAECYNCLGVGEWYRNTWDERLNYEVALHGVVYSVYTRECSENSQNKITYQFVTTQPKKRSKIFNEDRVFKTLEEANEFCKKYISSNFWDGGEPLLKSNTM